MIIDNFYIVSVLVRYGGGGSEIRRPWNNHGSDVADKISFTGDNGDNRDFEV